MKNNAIFYAALENLFSTAAVILLLGCLMPLRSNANENSKSLSSETAQSSCHDVDRGMSKEQNEVLSLAISKELGSSKVDILRSFKNGDWSIIDVNSDEADEAFLFYAANPLSTHHITLWSGAAKNSEGLEIRDWVLNNAHNIPHELADCFAWYVTKGRN